MTDDSAESWRPFPRYEGLYGISSTGQARSLPRQTSSGVRGGRTLTPFPSRDGYLSVRPSRNGVAESCKIHQAVCEAWHGPRPEGLQVRHLDGDKLNNTPGNLKWGTAKENAEDMRRHGTNHFANKTHCPAGHPYSGDNLILDADGGRKCRECLRERSARRIAEHGGEIYQQRRRAQENLSPEEDEARRERARQSSAKIKARKRAEVAAERAKAGLPPPVRNALKTHCKRGHPLSGDNLRVDKKGRRNCRICSNEQERLRQRERYATDPEYAEQVRSNVRMAQRRKREREAALLS